MGDSACVMHAYYASPISNEVNQGNPMHALGESISFGRFRSESLAWEKWSTFSHKRYVEEAASYAQPGSVAAKKAFFEAHYKRIAARKAAALLEQANAANNTTDSLIHANEHSSIAQQATPESYVAEKASLVTENEAPGETPMRDDSPNQLESELSGTPQMDVSGTPQMDKPFLEKSNSRNQEVSAVTSKKRPSFSSMKSSDYPKETPKVPPPPAMPNTFGDIKKANNVTSITGKPILDSMNESRSPPQSLHTLINLPCCCEPDKPPAPPAKPNKPPAPHVPQKIESSKVAPTSLQASKDFSTPLETPAPELRTSSGVSKHPSLTPCSEKRRTKMSVDPSVSGSKTTGRKWHILSAVSKSLIACRNKLQSPKLSAPFLLRTEERAARRKQEKAETKLTKLRQSFCFKAQPLPEFYKQKETTKSQIHKTAATHPQSP